MEFRILGPLEVREDGELIALSAGKQRALLADLLLHANRVVPTSRLVDDLWGDRLPDTAVKALQVYVSKLRKVLPGQRLHTRGPGYLLEVAEEELDLAAFTRLAADGREALAAGEARRGWELLTEALGLWRGPALAEFLEPFAQVEAARLDELRLGCLEARIDSELALGRDAELVSELEALVAAHPHRENLWSQLMRALYRNGRQAEALEAYQRFRRLLSDELGIEPTASLRDVERSILQQDPSLDPATPDRPARGHVHAPTVPRPVPARSRLVGRDAELDAITRQLHGAVDGHRRVVFVLGEAGAGKTTLVEAMLDYGGGREPLLVGRGQCVENRGSGEPYLPVLDAFGRLGRGAHGELVLDQLRRFAPTWLAQLASLVPPDEREWIATRAAGITAERMLREMTEALEALAAEMPLVIVLEDLHWSDPSTLTLVDAVARRSEPARLLVIGTSRTAPEGGEVRALARSLRLRNLASELAVGPLSGAAVGDYLEMRLPGHELPASVSEAVARRTRGVPLFVEKLVDSWLDSGAIAPSGEGWEVGVEVDRLDGVVPETLRELIEEQVRPLPPSLHALLEAASVVGTEFATSLVAAGAETDDVDADAALAELAAEGALIERRGEQRWPDGTVTTQYTFTHDLVQETLYSGLRAARRASLHGRVGVRLEQGYREDTALAATELAWHFGEANDAEHAVRHLLAAATRAFEKTAAREAQGHIDAAAALLPQITDERLRARLEVDAQLLNGSARILVDGWGSATVEDAFVRAVVLARELEDPGQLASALVSLSGMYEISGRYSISEQVVAEALELPHDQLSDELRVSSNELMACSLVHQGRHAQALAAADLALDLAPDEPVPRPVAVFGESPRVSAYVWSALALWHLGRPGEAMARAEQAVAAAVVAPRAFARSMACVSAAILSQLLGRPAATRQWAEAAIEASQRAGYPYWRAVASILRGWSRAVEGEEAEGLDELLAGLEAARATGARFDDAYFLALVAEVHLQTGALHRGLEAVDEAIEEMRDERSFYCEPELHRLRGELLLAQGERDDALVAFERALAIAAAQGAIAHELRAATSLAQARRDDETGRRLALLLASYTDGGETPDLVRARRLLLELEIDVPDHETSVPVGAGTVRPPVRYASSGALSIAYQVTGRGPPDLVLVSGFVSHLDLDWDEPRHAHFLDRIASFSRLIRFDKRGTGLSDRPEGLPDLETRMDDLRVVMDAAGSERAAVLGCSEGGPLSILFAATYPERVSALVLFGAYAKRMFPDDDYPWAPTREARMAHIEEVAGPGGFERQMRALCPSADETMARWWAERGRAAASPGAVRALLQMNSQIDVRDALRAVHVPTLVVHRRGDSAVLAAEGRYLARRIADAHYVELDGADHFVAIDPDQILDVVEPFVRSRPDGVVEIDAAGSGERVLATMLFTDLVGSTETAIRLGDAAWATLLDRHHETIREELRRFSGEEINTAGDGFLAVFDGPARAIRCGQAISERMRALDLAIRVGVHTGEVERANGTIRGIAVHVAARIADSAGPAEVLVSATTRDLVAGSGLEFADRGDHVLKGLDGPRRLFALAY